MAHDIRRPLARPRHRRPARRGLAALGLAACLPLGGCVLNRIDTGIQHTGQSIEQTNAELADLKAQVTRIADIVDYRLTALDTTNEELHAMRTSLEQVAEHLASFRRTIENANNVIPLLNVADPAPAPQAPAAEQPAPHAP